MKQNILHVCAVLASAFTKRLQASWAEFGAQEAFTATAAADLSALKYHVMRLTAAGPLINIASHNLGASAVGLAAGVLQTTPSSGHHATVAFAGLSKVVAGAAVTVNALVTHNSSGRAIDAVSGSVVIGRTLEAAAANGEVISVLLFPPVRWGSVA